MRIAFAIQDTGALYGAERATLDLVRSLAGLGQEVRVLLLRETRLGPGRPSLESAFREAGATSEAIPVDSPFSPALVRALRARMAAGRVEVLHTVGYKAGIHGGWASGWGRRLPWVCTVHGWLFRRDLKERFYGWLDIQAMRRASAVVVLSAYYQRVLAQWIAPSRLRLIPTGLPDSFFQAPRPRRPEEASSPMVVGTLGRLSEEKAQDLLVAAASLCRTAGGASPPMRFLLGGEGPLRGDLEARIRQLGVGDCVELPGFMDREEFLARIDVFVLCSRIENRPCSIMEAMAAGKPVVATAVGGIPELVEDGGTGLLVEPTPEALALALGRLAGDAEQRERMGAAGREKALREFRDSAMANAHLEMYRSLCPQS